MASHVDVVVVGAGVVGLAVARELSGYGLECVLIERHAVVGSETSSRNSEVVHAGLYYQEGSLKERLCIEGRKLLREYCTVKGVPYRKLGKLVVATDAQGIKKLDEIERTAARLALDGITRLGRADALALEPAVHCVEAVLSTETAIVDSHELNYSLFADVQDHGGVVALATNVSKVERHAAGFDVYIEGEASAAISTRMLVNASGLDAASLAQSFAFLDKEHIPSMNYVKGDYFSYSGNVPFRRLVYPVPEPGGLGVHLTLDLAGQARFGPDVEPVASPDYFVKPSKRQKFAAQIKKYWPGINAEKLQPGYAGIRPKIARLGEPQADFRIDGSEVHGVANLVNLFGIESPGLTSSLAIAKGVAEKLGVTG